MLFRKEKYFKNKTVLLLTHDFEPIVDMVLHHSDRFATPYATFLENKNGILLEKQINKTDIKSFVEINKENITQPINVINKIVYLRRLLEITDEKTMGYQVISNVLHKREQPTVYDGTTHRPMTEDEIQYGLTEVQRLIPEFDYSATLNIVKNDAQLIEHYNTANNNYEKLHIYRLLFDDKKNDIDSEIIQKFINQAFHIENDYIYQLNPRCFQLVPQYIIDECDKFVKQL